jgi:hypothetical protein
MSKKRKIILIVVAVVAVGLGVFFSEVTSGRRAIQSTVLEPGLIPSGIEQEVAFVNINVIPMDSERMLDSQTVITKDGRIIELGPSSTIEVSSEALVVDGEGEPISGEDTVQYCQGYLALVGSESGYAGLGRCGCIWLLPIIC